MRLKGPPQCTLSTLTRRSTSLTKRCFFPAIFNNQRVFYSQDTRMDQFKYTCDVAAEPLHRYRRGGYHPIHLGDELKNGRYKILHKLGWGGYSTVWAARDNRNRQYVALKIMVSDLERHQNHEARVMQAIAAIERGLHPGRDYLLPAMDFFRLDGPNGSHECIASELLGRNVPDLLESYYNDERLPATLAKSIAKQAILGLDCLHQNEIAHGDLHTRNLVLTLPSINSLNEAELMKKLKDPEIGLVRRNDGQPLEVGMPRYLVWPTRYPVDRSGILESTIRIVDYGEAFFHDESPKSLRTPLVVRPPEVIFGDKLDFRVDLWSMGCMLFELVAGQPPFDSIMMNPTSLVRQMLQSTGEELPERWKNLWTTMDSAKPGKGSFPELQEWLEDVYFDQPDGNDLTKEDIQRFGKLIRKLLHFEPSARASAKEIHEDSWFKER